jgi:hypothetical protein
VRCKSPGRANCQLSYPLEEKVLEVDVLDKVCLMRDSMLGTQYAGMQQQSMPEQ